MRELAPKKFAASEFPLDMGCRWHWTVSMPSGSIDKARSFQSGNSLQAALRDLEVEGVKGRGKVKDEEHDGDALP
jgi:hypothetical protein